MIIYRKKCKDLVIPVGLGPNVSEITGYDLQSKTVDSSTVEQFITSDVNFYGLYSVTVRPYILDAKTVDSSTVQQVVTSDASALYQVIVNPYTLESKSQTITQNGEYSFTPESADGISRVDISVNVADIPAVVQTKSVTYTENGEYILEPDQGYDGLSHVDISVEVPDVPTELQDKTVDPSTSSITVEPDQGYDGLSSVTVAAIDSSLDPDLQPENIKKDVEIFGVTGTFEGQEINNQTKTVDSSTTIQYVQPDQGYTGLDYVAVNPYVLDSKTVNPSTNSQTVTSDEDGLSSVTVNAVTAAIDPDLVPGNIKKDVNILGVVGTFEGGTLQSKTVDSSTSSQTITPDGANYGLSSVTVNPYTEETISETITQNGQYTYTAQNADTLSEVTIDVSVADIPAVIQTKSVTYTQNGEYTVTKDAGYDGMSSVDISVNVPTPEPELQTKTVSSSTNSQTVTPDQNYDGLSSVTVNPYALENKTVNSSTTQQTISADNGYDGLNMVTVNPYTLDSKTVDASTVSQTVTSSEDGLSSVTVNAVTAAIDPNIKNYNIVEGVTILGVTGSRHIANLQLVKYADSSTSVIDVEPDQGYDGMRAVYVRPYHLNTDSSVLTQNGQYVFEPAAGYNGLSQVTIDVSVDGQQINNQAKTVDSSTNEQIVTPDSGYTGLSQVTVHAYSYSGTVKINPWTYKDDFHTQSGYIGGKANYKFYYPYVGTKTVDASTVQVTYMPANDNYEYYSGITVNAVSLDSSTINSSTSQQVITPSQGNIGLSSVTVNPYTTEANSSVLTQNGTYTFTPQNADALSQVTIDVSVEGQTINNQNKTVNPSTNSQSVTADSGYSGLGTVTVNAVTAAIDPDLVPGNIKKNVEILGVIGTYEGPGSSSGIQELSMQGNDFSNLTINNLRTDVRFTINTGRMTGFPILRDSIDTDIIYFNGLETLDLTYIPQYTCINSTVSNLRAIDMPNLTLVTKPITGWITPWKDLTLSINWHALTYSSANYNITADIGSYLRYIFPLGSYGEGDYFITDSIYLSWASSLSRDGVIAILTYLGSNVSNKSVNFYTGGLTITDNYIGQVQSLYNRAVSNGWTINNLTISPF
jgi:hypothetical protein